MPGCQDGEHYGGYPLCDVIERVCQSARITIRFTTHRLRCVYNDLARRCIDLLRGYGGFRVTVPGFTSVVVTAPALREWTRCGHPGHSGMLLLTGSCPASLCAVEREASSRAANAIGRRVEG